MKSEDESITLKPPLTEEGVSKLEVGDTVKISGTIFTTRDKAYRRILELSEKREEIPVDLDGGVVYHCGPLAKSRDDGWEILAAGPTTSARMDHMQTDFVETTGVRALIGKGGVSQEVASSLKSQKCVYLAYTGGAAALAAKKIESVKDIIWEELGTAEAIWVLKVRDFGPLVVAIDTKGQNIYQRK